MPGTVRLHRVLKAPPEKVYRAFLEPDALIYWLSPFGFTANIQKLDARVGGTLKMSFTNFTNKQSHAFTCEYLELVPNEKIVHNDRFDDPNLPGTLKVTILFRKVSVGTDLSITQEGIPDVIPVEMCYLGWQDSLVQLANLVEPNIP